MLLLLQVVGDNELCPGKHHFTTTLVGTSHESNACSVLAFQECL